MGESADVGTDKRNAAESEVEEHLGGEAEVVPGSGIVAGPGEAVALPSCEGRAGEDEGTFVGAQFEEALIGAAGIFESNDIVNLRVRGGAGHEAGLFDAVNAIEGHSLAGSVEDRGLVHIIPEAGNAVVDEILVETAPPVAGTSAGEIWKNGGAGPDDTDEFAAVGIPYEVIAGLAGVVGRIALAGGMSNVEVSDGDQMEMLLAEIGDQRGKIREGSWIDGEGPILVLVIDVQIKHVGRNLVRAKAVGDLPDFGFRSIAIARLLEAKRPEWRQWRCSSEVGICLENLFRRGAVDQVVVEWAALSAKGIGVTRLLAEVEPSAPGVVEEEPVTAAAIDTHKERDAFIDGVGGFMETNVSVPQSVCLISAVERTGFVPEAEVMLVSGHRLIDGETLGKEGGGATDSVGGDYVASEIANDEAERSALNADVERCGTEAD